MKTKLATFRLVTGEATQAGVMAFDIELLDIAESMGDVATLGGQAQRLRLLSREQAAAEGWTVATILAALDVDKVRDKAVAAAFLKALCKNLPTLAERLSA